MFWRFGLGSSSAIDSVLQQPDVTLEQVLSDQDVIQEVKSQNPKLIEFLIKKNHLSQLIDYFHSLDVDRERVSVIACEVLSCDIPQLIDAVVLKNQDLLTKLWDFLQTPYSIEPSFSLQAAYFCKIIVNFLTKRTVEMLTYIKSTPGNLKMLLSHLHNASIMDLLFTLIRLEVLPEAKGVVRWLSDNGLLINLLYRLDPNLDIDEHFTAQQCICEIIRMSQTSLIDSPSIGANDIITGLTSKETVQTMVDFMLDTSAPNSISSLTHCVTILIDVIRHNNSDLEQSLAMGYSQTTMDHHHQQQQQQQPQVRLVDMLDVLTRHISKFAHLLMNPTAVDTTSRKNASLGFERLKVCEMFAELLHCSNMSSLNPRSKEEADGDSNEREPRKTQGDLLKIAFVEHRVIPICIDLFFAFPWNNFLHYIVYDILHQVFNGQMSNESNKQLALSAFNQGHLTDKIIEAQRLNDLECAKPKGSRLGYMGHLTFIADEVVKLFEGYPDCIVHALDASVDMDGWHRYCKKQLAETKERDTLPLGGPKSSPAVLNDESVDGEQPSLPDNGKDEANKDEYQEDSEDEDDAWQTEPIEKDFREQLSVLEYTAEEESSEEEEVEEYSSSSDDEQEYSPTHQKARQWSGVEYDPFSTAAHNKKEASNTHKDSDVAQDTDTQDPFGDFASVDEDNDSGNSSSNWENGFSSNFSDMDLGMVKLTPDTDNPAASAAAKN